MQIKDMRGVLLCSASAMALALSAPVAKAQDVSEEDGFLGLLVLGNNKREVQTDTAAPETVINAEEIQDRQASSIAELIDSVPGVALVNSGTPTGAGINIRGHGADGTYGANQKVQIQIDGASVGSEELYRIGTQLTTDPELYREVSVIRGTVGSFEYGSGVIGGVVRLDTINASDLTDGQVGLSGRQTLGYHGNSNARISSTILGWQPTENLEFLLNYTRREQDDYTDGNGDVVSDTASEVSSLLLKGKYSFGDNAAQSLTLSFNESTSDEKDVPYDAFAGNAAFGNVDRLTETKSAVLEYAFNPLGNDLVDLTATLSYADQYIEQEQVSGTPFGIQDADHRYETTKLTVKNSALFQAFGAKHTLRAGAEILRKERLNAASAPGGTDQRLALFAIDELDFDNGLTVTPALRYERQEIEASTDGNNVRAGETFNNSALMGGISARYAFQNGFAVFGSVAYTAGFPIIDDVDYADYPTLMTQTEKAVTHEIGASFDRVGVFASDDVVMAKVNLWQTRLWDYTSSGSSFAEFDRQDTKGVEIEASYSHMSGFYVDMNANISSGHWTKFQSGTNERYRERYDGMPPTNLALTLGKKFNEQLDVSWEGAFFKRFEDTPGFAVHNLRASYDIDTGFLKEAKLRVGVDNLFDKQYQTHLATRPAPGRNIKVSLTAAF